MKKRLLVMISMLVILVCHMIGASNRELLWKKSSQAAESKLPANVRGIMISNLTTDFNKLLSSSAKLNRDFTYYPYEKEYYFTGAVGEGSSEDFLCYSNVSADAVFEFQAQCHGLKQKGKWPNYYGEAKIEVDWWADVTFTEGGGANRSQTFTDPRDSSSKPRDTGVWFNVEAGIHGRYDCDPNDPIIYRNAFAYNPPKHFSYGYSWDYDVDYGDWGNIRHDWENKKQSYTYYPARSARPRINENVQKQFDDDENNDAIHNKRIFQFDIIADMNVKILHVKFFKYDKGSNSYLDDSTNNPDEIATLGSNKGGIDYIRIGEIIKNSSKLRFTQEGKYMMALGAVDKFNRIYVFEPEYFIIDKTPPVVSNFTKVEKTYINYEDPVIADLTNATLVDKDNVTDFSKVDWGDYLYVVEKETGVPVLLKNSPNLSFIDKKIKIKNENIRINIDKIYFVDKAGNESNLIMSNEMHCWDKTKPVVTLKNPASKDLFINGNNNIVYQIDDFSNIKINSVSVKLDGIESNLFNHYVSATSNLLIINLSKFRGLEGKLEVNLETEDEAENKTIVADNFDNYDDKAPLFTASLEGEELSDFYSVILNTQGQLKINVSDKNYKRVELDFESDSALRKKKILLYPSNINYLIEKESDVYTEDIIMSITVWDKSNNFTRINNIKIKFLNDTRAPQIYAIQIPESEGSYQVEVSEKEDRSTIGKIYYKEIEYDDPESISIESFGDLPPIATDWQVIGENVESFKTIIDILPKHAACIIAEDVWGNIMSGDEINSIILINPIVTSFEINSQENLDTLSEPWVLYGDVIINTDITVGPTKTLTITTKSFGATNINFKASLNKYKIINNGGKIIIDSSVNNIIFKGIGEKSEDYSWFGIINETGDLTFVGDNKISFQDAVSPLVFVNPDTDRILNYIEFKNCKMGIHFIDESNSFNKLQINNISFTDNIYGVKFDFYSTIDKEQYLDNFPYLIEDNIIVDNIIRAHIYCPIKGLINFTNYKNSPKISDVKITGTPVVGETLSINYTYTGDYPEKSDGTTYQWYVSVNNRDFKPIIGAIDKEWTVTADKLSKYIKVRVIPMDSNLCMGSPVYNNGSVKITNQKPIISNLTISGSSSFGSTLTADYQYYDPDGDLEKASIYQWYYSDSENGTYYSIQNAVKKNWTVINFKYSEKWVKVKVIPYDDKGSKGDEYYSDPVQLGAFKGPMIYNIGITGNKIMPGETIYGNYKYVDSDGFPEYGSIYDWLVSDTEDGEYASLGINQKELILQGNIIGMYIKFAVTPIDEIGLIGFKQGSLPVRILANPPYVTNMTISNNHPKPGEVITGSYTFVDLNGFTEEGSSYSWYISDTSDGLFIPIADAISTDLSIIEEYEGKWIKFGVTPRNSFGAIGELYLSNAILVKSKVRISGTVEYRTPGTYSWRLRNQYPDIINITATITIVGGGGGGGGSASAASGTPGCGGGGGGGGAGQRKGQSVNVDEKKQYYIVIGYGGGGGKGGAKAHSGDNGSPGSISQIIDNTGGVLISAYPGSGGSGGSNSGGGGSGGSGYPYGNNQSNSDGGAGGNNGGGFGTGGRGGASGHSGGDAPANSGGGGGGAGGAVSSHTADTGGTGGSGYIRIVWHGYIYQ